MKKVLFAIVCACVCFAASANGSVSGKVQSIRIDKDGRGIVVFNQPVGGAPASCRHEAYTNALSFDTNTAGGKSILALLLSAKASDATIGAGGTGGCGIYDGAWVEDWSYGSVN